MMEPIRLWRDDVLGRLYYHADMGATTEYAALPRADFDAREAEYRDAEVLMARMRDVVAAATARADKAEQERDEARAYRTRTAGLHSELERERDAVTARADKAEKDRDDARAMLREAAPFLDKWRKGYPLGLRARIDAALEVKK